MTSKTKAVAAGLVAVKTALVSVFDKTNLIPFAQKLKSHGVRILSTGQTAKALRDAKIECEDVSQVTGFPEMLDGRVKTLHPKIHGGILACRDKKEHMDTLKAHSISTIDLVVVSLYPFKETVKKGKSREETIEMIDIGGPAMLRSAAKNSDGVAAICDIADYNLVQNELDENSGSLSAATRQSLAAKVFEETSKYDHEVAQYLALGKKLEDAAPDFGPEHLVLKYVKVNGLRYGENPHQKAALYRLDSSVEKGVAEAEVLGGKELSFNNFLDLESAWRLAYSFPKTVACVMKHTNPCGVAIGKNSKDAFLKAHECDPLSAFGGIVGLNSKIDEECAEAIARAGFLECVIAPEYSDKAVEILKQKKNLRIVKTQADPNKVQSDFKRITGGLLLQDPDLKDVVASDLKVVTNAKPAPGQIDDLLFAFKLTRFVKSNAIVVVKSLQTIGLGMGLTSRVDSAILALNKAGDRAKGSVLASDGFFPKIDTIEEAAKAGVSAIIQPGGSIKDEAVVAEANKLGIPMVITGVRHFSH